jgi:hypothetical protein
MKKAKAAKVATAPVVDVEIADVTVEKQYGARPSLAKACPFCKHSYLKPCNDKTKESCPNYQHLKGRKK